MSSQSSPVSLYLHIPFCVTKCNYCDFNTYAGIEDLMPAYVSAVVDEIGMWGESVGERYSGADDILRGRYTFAVA